MNPKPQLQAQRHPQSHDATDALHPPPTPTPQASPAPLAQPPPAPQAQSPAAPQEEQRQSLRLDKIFPVWISSSEFGELSGVARNISAGGIFIELAEPLPLGSPVRVHFRIPESDAEVVALGEVK